MHEVCLTPSNLNACILIHHNFNNKEDILRKFPINLAWFTKSEKEAIELGFYLITVRNTFQNFKCF